MKDLLMQRGNQDPKSRTSPELNPPAGRNKECPINKLPPEVLIILFHIALESLPPGTRYSKALRALRVVSVRWSSLIDQAATLWARSSCLDPEKAVKMALRKSAGALLRVACVCGVTEERYDYAALVLPHSRRWSSLEAGTAKARTIVTLLSGQLPNLRSLTVLSPPNGAGPQSLQLDPTTYQLRYLTIRYCSISGFQFAFPYLRGLDLIGLSPQGPSVDQVITVLAACADSLECLGLAQSVIRPHPRQFCPENRVSLPKLRYLAMGGINGASVTQILASMDLPNSVSAFGPRYGPGYPRITDCRPCRSASPK
ncbi:hypothetical protein M407DRAFT_11369 [Tulasnella calospora MUT 4182]|uniref:F-box domain-containing protein n=1 Tax=Tulasnella calospora MUT 4182 TaxID=1051891 RepID=A0A0C3KDG0_9AGAM|nr:hypothetical protein M407DRAFT_11369 [Tulasnella calospora MUT 4182]